MTKTNIVVTNLTALESKYGETNCQKIKEDIIKLEMTYEAEGYNTGIFYVDKELNVNEWEYARIIRNEIYNQYNMRDIANIVLIGNNDIIPFFLIENPVSHIMDKDEVVYSDMIYGCLDNGDLFDFVPQVSVGRIPDSQGNELNVFSLSLKRAIEQREALIDFTKDNFFGVYAEKFDWAIEPILRPLDRLNQCLISPPTSIDNIVIPQKDIQWMIFDIHGSDITQYWYGDSKDTNSYPKVISPDIIQEMKDLNNSIVFALPCYGGFIFNKTSTSSNALALIRAGVNELIASSMIVWFGLIESDLLYGNRLAQQFLLNRHQCKTIGKYLMDIKRTYLEEIANNAEREGESYVYLSLKTLLEFNLYGDPSMMMRFS